MQITKIKNEPEVLWEIEGYIDSDNYHELEEELLKLDYNNISITLDMTNVPYVTSAFIRTLLVCRKKIEKEKLILINTNECIKEIFTSSGFDDMITFEKTDESDINKKSYAALLYDRVKEKPDKVAYIHNDVSYTWEDIEKQSHIIASDIEKLGVKKGSRVGLFSANSINWITTFFAIQKLGAIAVFLDFNLDAERLKLLVDIGDIEYICYGKIKNKEKVLYFFEKEKSSIKSVYYIGYDEKEVDFRNRYAEYETIKDNYREYFHADDPAMIVFTSGSTSKPKAVISSAYNRIFAAVIDMKMTHFTEKEVVCLYLPLFHVFAFTTAITLQLIADATICLTIDTSKESILDTIQKYNCTYLSTIPTYLATISNTDVFNKYNVDSVNSIVLGGEPITIEQINAIKSKFKNAHIIIGYGLSEIVPVSKTLPNDSVKNIIGTVGKILDGIKIKIVDIKTGKVCKNGEVGEIRAYSDFAMTGYYKLDIDSQPLDEEGYIMTGDLGYKRDDNYLVYTGRLKELIIKNGENIAPNEIVVALNTYEGIESSKVFGVPDKEKGEEIAAAIVMKEGYLFDENKINEYLLSKLSKNKIPKYYKIYDEMPLLSNNKIDMVTIKNEIIKEFV